MTGNFRPRPDDSWSMGLFRRAFLLAAGLVVLTASPALAHALNGAAPSNFRTRVLDVKPDLPGIEVEVVEAGNRLLLTNTGQEEAVVLGYQQEPYLRVGPDGVFENLRSPATYRNRSRFPTEQVPAIARNPNAPPQWKKVSDDNSARFHDHRVHWMDTEPPSPVQRDPGREHVIIPAWEVPIVVGDEKMVVTGDLAWIPGPSKMPWIGVAVAVGLGFAALVLGPGSRRTRLATISMVAALAVLVVFDIGRLAGLASSVDSSLGRAAGQNLQAVAGWVTAVAAIVLLLRGDQRAGPALAAGAGVLFALGGLGDIDILSSSQVASDAPMWFNRLTVAMALALGLGLLVAAFAPLVTPSSTARAPAEAPPRAVPAD